MSWYVTSGAATDTGRVREANEDAYLVAAPLYAVADGMGGHAGGEVASALALETLRAGTEGTTHESGRGGAAISLADLAAAVRAANGAVYERQSRESELAGMGTTLTAMIIDDAGIRVAHVGDSRAYLLRDGELKQITQDHTLVRELVEEGSLTEEQAREHPQRSMLTRAVGIDAGVELDEALIAPKKGDRIMLCSDGLTGMVEDARIRETLIAHERPQNAADTLVAMANDAGGVDNTTVIVLDLSDEAPPAPGVDPVTGQQTSKRTFADEIVIHGSEGFSFRSRPVQIALGVIGLLVVIALIVIVTGN